MLLEILMDEVCSKIIIVTVQLANISIGQNTKCS